MKKRITSLLLAFALLLTVSAYAAVDPADRSFIIDNLFPTAYSGSTQTPKPIVTNASGAVLTEGRDYRLAYADNKNAGTATVTVTGIGDYGAVTVNGTRYAAVIATARFEITPRDLYITVNDVTVRANQTPKFSYMLTSGKLVGSDSLPTPSYRLYERTGDTRWITATFSGSIHNNYAIHVTDGVLTYAGMDEPAPSGSVSVGSIGKLYYNGKEQRPAPKLTASNGVVLRKDTDYTLSYSNNRDAGTATLAVTGLGSYAGQLNETVEFEILPAPVTIRADDVRCRLGRAPDEYDYTITSGTLYGSDELGDVTIKAVSRSGYSYGPVFDLKVTVKNANPNYKITTKNGTMTYTDVEYEEMSGDGLEIQKISAVTYNGEYQEPEVAVRNDDGYKLREGTDYTLTYKNNLHAGTATVTAVGQGTHAGERDSRTFIIEPRAVTVTVHDATAMQGERFSVGTYTVYPALCRGDSLGRETWTGTDTSRIGRQTLKVSFPAHEDYDVTVKSGTLTVLERLPEKTALGTPRTFSAAVSGTNPFKDVKAGSWYEDAALWCHENGLLLGTTAEQFLPAGTVTRAQAVMALYRLNDSPRVYGTAPFTDLQRGSWYEDAVVWASQNGIVNGRDDLHFAPDDVVTREQLAVLLYRYTRANGFDASQAMKLTGYTDYAQLGAWARDAMSWALGAKVMWLRSNAKTQLLPKTPANRAELAASLYSFCLDYSRR